MLPQLKTGKWKAADDFLAIALAAGHREGPAVGIDRGESKDAHRPRSRANDQFCVGLTEPGFAACLIFFLELIGECLSCLLSPNLGGTAIGCTVCRIPCLVYLDKRLREKGTLNPNDLVGQKASPSTPKCLFFN
jgi:hypothetical protein